MSNNNQTNWHEREMNYMKDWGSYGIVEYITKEPIYVANPEFAFGIVRKMAAKNKLRYKHIVKFLQQHPAWNQVIFTVENMGNVNGLFLEQVKETGVLTQKRGSKETFKEHNIQFAIHGKGMAKVATMTESWYQNCGSTPRGRPHRSRKGLARPAALALNEHRGFHGATQVPG